MTDPTPGTPKPPKALAYAETVLGVHAVLKEAQDHRDLLDKTLSDLAELRDRRRLLEEQIETRTIELTSDEWGRHPDKSVAAMDRHLKLELHKDTLLAEHRARLGQCVSDIEGLEYDIRVIETDIRIAVARMTELGGYFTYLAAIKAAEQAK